MRVTLKEVDAEKAFLFLWRCFSLTQRDTADLRLIVPGDTCAEHLSIRKTVLRFSEDTNKKYEDEYNHRGLQGPDTKRSFTSETFQCPAWIFLHYLCCFYFVKCKSLYKSPSLFIPSGTLMFFCYFGGRFCFPFNHPSTSLFVCFSFFLFQSIYMYRKTQNISSLLSGCTDDLTECC